jgi:hypothetical protein
LVYDSDTRNDSSMGVLEGIILEIHRRVYSFGWDRVFIEESVMNYVTYIKIKKKKEKTISENKKAWAIDTCSDEGHGFIGIYWWFHDGESVKSSQVPNQCKGSSIALFEYRKLAEEQIRRANIRATFPKAKVVSVDVIVKRWR